MKLRRFSILLVVITIIFNLAISSPYAAKESDAISISIEEAVKIGLENSIELRQVKNEIDLSALKQDRTNYLSKKLEDGDERLKDGRRLISSSQSQLSQGINQLQQGLNQAGLNIDVEQAVNSGKVTIGNQEVTIDELPDEYNIVLDANGTKLSDKLNYIRNSELQIDASKESLDSGELELTNSLQEAGSALADKLNFDSLDALGVDATTNLSTTMADVSFEVTQASYEMYKNQIAMLIEKNYYDILKAQKILDVKKKAMDRGQKQYDFTKISYDEGMKSKDDMLLAELYYKGTQIAYMKAKGDLENTLTELKKSMNIPLATHIMLTDALMDEREIPQLEDGLDSGLKNRLEVKKALGEIGVYDLNFELTKRKYPDITFQYREAKLLKEKARINYEKVLLSVENSIRQSYETLKSTGEMLKVANGMVEKAKENVEISEYKYKEGFGIETSLLKKLDLESAAGTIVEVLAAEENLSDVEEKVIEIEYGYNLAKTKYYNDAGKYIY